MEETIRLHLLHKFDTICDGNIKTLKMLSSAKKSVWTKDSISIENLDIQIGSTKLLKSACFSISQGERIAVLGRNGCGKSTLFHWINEKTGIQNASKVRSEIELSTHVFGKLAAAVLLLTFRFLN